MMIMKNMMQPDLEYPALELGNPNFKQKCLIDEVLEEEKLREKEEEDEDNFELVSRIEIHKDCPEKATTLRVNRNVFAATQQLLKEFEGCEWAVFWLGETRETNHAIDYYIPEQEVQPCHVTITEKPIPLDIHSRVLVHVHSHHHMGEFHSGEDEDYMNYKYHVVFSNKGYIATARIKASCGRFIRSEVKLEIVDEPIAVVGINKIKEVADEIIDYYNERLDDFGYFTEGLNEGLGEFGRRIPTSWIPKAKIKSSRGSISKIKPKASFTSTIGGPRCKSMAVEAKERKIAENKAAEQRFVKKWRSYLDKIDERMKK